MLPPIVDLQGENGGFRFLFPVGVREGGQCDGWDRNKRGCEKRREWREKNMKNKKKLTVTA